MANAKVQSSVSSMMYNGRNSLLPPKCPFPIHPSAIARNALPKPREGYRHNHNRTSSESFLIEEQPSWLDELLNEPETPVGKSHRRSSSDSLAYLEGNMNCVAQADNYFQNSIPVPAWGSQQSSFYAVVNSSSKAQNGISSPSDDAAILDGGYMSASEENSGVNKDLSQAKYYDTDPKRVKQQFAQRSRVRKLQYIAELERNVQVLLAEGSGISAELEFVNQQNIILSMENKALKQRLENLSQEQLIKCLEHEVLEREVARLRNLFKHQQLQPLQQQQMPSSHRRSKSRDIDHQFANLSLKPNQGI